jgi:asparagine synthase (glutamine-hydrolysing)
MCGICGVVGYGDADTVRRMRDCLAHRGPDRAGAVFFPEQRVGLGHRRLSIIDLSTDADQPMTQEDDSLWIVFNGEIYNFADLRQGLTKRGHRFKSRSDTEVILHLYEEEGTRCFAKLNGMFALALYDKARDKLVLARDQVGIKPLYYHHRGSHFSFASEIKALLASGDYTRALNVQALYDYFTYLYVPCPDTIFEGIYQVPPAHVLELDITKNEQSCWAYWQVGADLAQVNGNGKHKVGSYEEVKRELRELLTDSVRLQLVSDVPLGVFLSGGVDSPILTGLMAQASARPVKTFTVVFAGKDVEFFNEQESARAVAQTFATDHHEISVDISDPTDILNLVSYFDQPFGNPTSYLMYLISKVTRQEVKVALCGAGGDELFAGYPRYRAIALSRWLTRLPSPLLNCVRALADVLPSGYRSTRWRRVAQFLQGLDGDFAQQLVKWVYFLDKTAKSYLFQADILSPRRGGTGLLPSERIVRERLAQSPVADFGNRVLHLDVQTFLLDNILEYTDKMSMATSLEVRVPYLDHRLVERSLHVPFHYKLQGAHSKVILKDAFADLLPPCNLKLPKKGFNAPLSLWVRNQLDGYFDQHMDRDTVTREGILNWDQIQVLRAQHRTGRRDHAYDLFAIIMFDVWWRTYFN